MAEITIVLICDATDHGSPALSISDKIAQRLVRPAISSDIEYHLMQMGSDANSGAIHDFLTVDVVAADELVIADLTEVSGGSSFIIEARDRLGLPIIYLCDQDYQLPADRVCEPLIRYSLHDLDSSVLPLKGEVERALTESEYRGSGAGDSTPRDRCLELATRIEATVEVLRLLRINSASQSIDDLVAVAKGLQNLPDENIPSRLREAADKALQVLNALLDELSTQPGARMAITGAISLIVGGAGASGAAAFGAGLSFWYGKDVFTKFINTWGKRNQPIAKKSKKK